MTETRKEYYFSKPVIILSVVLILALVLILILAGWFLFTNDMKLGTLVCLIVLLLFIPIVAQLFRRIKFLMTNTPALILTHEQLIDNINYQRFSWTDIKDFSAQSVKLKTRVSFIAINLIDPDKYIQQIRRPFGKLIARINDRYFGGAFSIQPNIVRYDNKKLLDDLQSELKTKHLTNSR